MLYKYDKRYYKPILYKIILMPKLQSPLIMNSLESIEVNQK